MGQGWRLNGAIVSLSPGCGSPKPLGEGKTWGSQWAEVSWGLLVTAQICLGRATETRNPASSSDSVSSFPTPSPIADA